MSVCRSDSRLMRNLLPERGEPGTESRLLSSSCAMTSQFEPIFTPATRMGSCGVAAHGQSLKSDTPGPHTAKFPNVRAERSKDLVEGASFISSFERPGWGRVDK